MSYAEVNTTIKMPLNGETVSKILKYGNAMLFGKNVERGVEHSVTSSGAIQGVDDSNEIALWLSEDYEKNSMLLRLLVTQSANSLSPLIHCGFNSACTEYVIDPQSINEYSQKEFQLEISNLIESINQSELLATSDSTLELAQQVADMDDGEVDIDSWARRLANDIGKGRD